VPAPLIWAPTLVLLHEGITIGLTPFSLAVTAMTLALAPLRSEDVKTTPNAIEITEQPFPQP
jgi:hypothetical protein